MNSNSRSDIRERPNNKSLELPPIYIPLDCKRKGKQYSISKKKKNSGTTTEISAQIKDFKVTVLTIYIPYLLPVQKSNR